MNKEIKQRIEQLNNGKIPNGYQKTDFGVFPSDWVTDKTLGDLFDFYGGLSKSRDELGEEGYAYLHYGDLHRGTFNTVSINHYEQLPKCDISLTGKEKCLMKDGDVAFLDASEDLEGTSRAVLIDNPENKPFIAGLHIISGKAKNNSLDKWFKQYITSSESVKKQFQRLSVGFKVYGVNRDTIPRIRVAFPSSLKEQSRIAEILMIWDKASELYDKQIEALTRYKAVCLRKMFPTKGQNVPEWRFQGFTGAWEQRKVADIASDTRGGGTPKTSNEAYWTGDIPWIQSSDLSEGKVYGVEPRKHISMAGLNGSATQLVPENSIAVVTRVGVGKLAYMPYSYTTSQDFLSLCRLQTEPIFTVYGLYHLLQGELSAVQGTSIKGMTKEDLLSKTISAPKSIDEQAQIGAYFKGLDNLITLHQRKKEAITNQRKTLQQYLLNGIVRVKS